MYALLRSVSSFFRMHMFDYCHLEGPDLYHKDAPHVMVNKDGGLVSMFELYGAFSYMGEQEFAENLQQLVKSLKGTLTRPGFRLEFYFSRDPENALHAVSSSVQAMTRSARAIGLDELEAVARERGQVIADATYLERAYVVLTTTTGVLTPGQAKDALNERQKIASELGLSIKPGEFGQSPLVAIEALRDIHGAMARTLGDRLGDIMKIRKLSAHEMVKAMAFCLGPGIKHKDWKPRLAGDSFPAREFRESGYEADISHVCAPDIGMQLFDRVVDTTERRGIVRYGDTYHAPVSVDVPPERPTDLNTLVRSVDETLPFCIKMVIDTGTKLARSKASNKHGWAGFLALFNSDNRLIHRGANELIDLADDGEALAMVQIQARTWGHSLKEAVERRELLMQGLQGWGSMDPLEEFGDEVQAWVNTVPGLSLKHIANRYPMLLEDAFMMAPLARPASPWEGGSQLYRTVDRKVFPFYPRSSKQTTNNDLYYAPPGFGKSFKLSADNMSAILMPGQKRLPRIGILDIGFSSRSFVEFIRDALPHDRKHEAITVTYQMTHEYAVNPFGTPLGCRAPLSTSRSFLVNFLTLVLTPASATDPIERLDELVGTLVDEMYYYFRDDRNPKLYQEGIDPEVDEALNAIAYYPSEETSWWRVVDKLFEHNRDRGAVLAQRYAVPTLSDATEVLSASTNIRDNYGHAGGSNRDLIKHVSSMLTSAITEYPILGQPTRFDFGNARIISLDLQDVADTGSRQADKQTSIMYMLGRHMLASDFYQSQEVLSEIPEEYREWHRKRILDSEDDVKILELDEFHRTKGSPSVRAQVVRDMREGRKFGVTIRLLSQMVNDFDEEMISLSTNIFILSRGGSEDDARRIDELFSPGKEVMEDSKLVLRGPGPEGSTMIYLAKLKGERESNVSQLLYMPMGPKELWAYTTTPEDVRLRRMISEQHGLSKGLGLLAARYPGGSAKKDIENRLVTEGIDKDQVVTRIMGELAAQA